MANQSYFGFKKWIGAFVAIGFPSLGFVAILYLALIGPSHRKLVDKEVFSSYVSAIAEGRFYDAWNFYDGPYKEQQPLQKFVEHYKTLTKTYGRLQDHKIYSARGTFSPFQKGSGYTVDCILQFEKISIRANYTLVLDQDGKFYIHRSGTSSPLFRAQGLPW